MSIIKNNKKMFKSCDFSEESNQDKTYIQRLLYSLSGVKGNATVVSGPALDRHISDFNYYIKSNTSNKLNIVEIDKTIYTKLRAEIYSLYKNNKNITLYNCDIINAPLERFVDADLTQTIDTTLNIFKVLFIRMHYLDLYKRKKQYKNKVRDLKKYSLICTYAVRNSKIDFLDALEEITSLKWNKLYEDEKLPLINPSRSARCIKKTYNDVSGEYKCYCISYRFKNGSPMITFSINWKI